ncbi:MAG: carboxypeptidase regulatory-like domain-containing protein, partial [Acidobacteria bacterium]|nr:carboxypeptidase regulatory-like domain-containing protein [Acidobacteriota bacterium]
MSGRERGIRVKSMRLKVFFGLILLFCAAPSYAQYRASIQGVVTDPDGAVVSGATLTLTNLETNRKLVATSDASGVYNFNAL